VALLLAVQSGILDPLPPEAVKAFRSELPENLDRDACHILGAMSGTGELDERSRTALIAIMTRLAAQPGDAEPAT
jgi:F-type H+-transporting ATPase subunit alpha